MIIMKKNAKDVQNKGGVWQTPNQTSYNGQTHCKQKNQHHKPKQVRIK